MAGWVGHVRVRSDGERCGKLGHGKAGKVSLGGVRFGMLGFVEVRYFLAGTENRKGVITWKWHTNGAQASIQK